MSAFSVSASLDPAGSLCTVSEVKLGLFGFGSEVESLKGKMSDISLDNVVVTVLGRISLSPSASLKYSPSGLGANAEGGISDPVLVPSRSLEPTASSLGLRFMSVAESSFGCGTWSSIIFPSSALCSKHLKVGQH